ncbi:MAG: RagB/SusD family nutrient uptake outer membrane protein [Muribaculaceae bacterium]|nr:RagB/SusD family nutrient uptake outer membrane protein [Muribaculaceae bacterium]
MNIKKYLVIGALAMGFVLTSCVGDLDLQPNDPNLVDENAPDFKENTLAMCYTGIACSGISGPGSSYVSGIDAGTSAYLRMIFTLGEFCTDELVWIWPNDQSGAAGEITSCTWGANNVYLEGTYYRLVGHIALCNQFLFNFKDDNSEETLEMKAEARTLRAYSYYNMLDLFGKSSFITEEAEVGEEPKQYTRQQLFDWLESELVDIVDNSNLNEKPVLGRVGKDGAEALLAKLYLNGEVWTGSKEYWAKCQQRCSNLISRHQGGGFKNSGLANDYLYLFCIENGQYMQGGSRSGEDEILFGIWYDKTYTQSYGGSTFLVVTPIANTHYIPIQNYGSTAQWGCIRAKLQMAQKFYGLDNDIRDDLWMKGGPDVYPAGEDANDSWVAEDYSDTFIGFTGEWVSCGGNAPIKFTNRYPNAAWDGGWDMQTTIANAADWSSAAQPIIRLADIYLMWAECYLQGGGGDATTALNYVNLIRERAGSPDITSGQLTIGNIMNERSRELYMESWRRNDLVRNGYFAGANQITWQIKGNLDNMEGTRIAERNNIYPIPLAVLAAQPDFTQNEGY